MEHDHKKRSYNDKTHFEASRNASINARKNGWKKKKLESKVKNELRRADYEWYRFFSVMNRSAYKREKWRDVTN